MRHERTTVVKVAPPELPFVLPQARRPAAASAGSVLREPIRMLELLRSPGSPNLTGPVLVARAGAPLDAMLAALVHPVGALTPLPAPPGARLEGELVRFAIGRTSANDIVVDDATVSKRHASVVRLSGDRWVALDEGSSNGTFIDGRPLEPGRPVPLGAVHILRVGPYARFAFMHPEVFFDYLDQLRVEHERRGPTVVAERLPSRDAYDRLQATASGGTYEPIVARIVAALRRAPAGCGYRVSFDGGASVSDVATISEVATLVATEALRVSRIDVRLEDGWLDAVYVADRATTESGRRPRISA